MAARAANSALVAGPPAANSLKSPSRSPTAASTMVVKALVSVSTFPKNCSVFVVSTVCTAICRSSFWFNWSTDLISRPIYTLATAQVSREAGNWRRSGKGQTQKREAVPNRFSLRESMSLAAGQNGLGLRGETELAKHSKPVLDSPVLGDLAVGHLDEVCLRPLRVLSGCGHPKRLSLVGAADGRVGSYEVAVGDLEIDPVFEVRESFAQLRCDCLESLAAGWNARHELAVLLEVGRTELVDDIEASLLEHFKRNAPRNRFVLFC